MAVHIAIAPDSNPDTNTNTSRKGRKRRKKKKDKEKDNDNEKKYCDYDVCANCYEKRHGPQAHEHEVNLNLESMPSHSRCHHRHVIYYGE